MGDVILCPRAAAETVCHEEQLRIWAHEVTFALVTGDYLNFSSHDDAVDIEAIVMQELKSIIESAFDHPEAVTMRRRK